MSKIFEKVIKFQLAKFIICAIFFAALILLLGYYNLENTKISVLYGGLSTGLIIAGIQLLFSWGEFNEMEKIKKMGIKKILPHRDDERLYRNVIRNSKREILVLGNTASRFFIDFADETRDDKKTLIDALGRGTKVKILLPNPKWLSAQDKLRAQISLKKIKELSSRYKTFFECRYYDHAPFHSLVLADDHCLVGPIFPNIPSKDSPAIYTDNNSIYANSYLRYFDYEWEDAKLCT